MISELPSPDAGTIPPPADERKIFRVGVLLSATFLIALLIYCAVVWPSFKEMDPNEFGDFLAGVFGPLALLWVVLGFLQQGEELRDSRHALLLQAEELRLSVKAQNEMAQAAWEQLSLDREGFLAAKAKELEPVLVLFGAGSGSGGGKKYYRFNLKNHGALAQKIIISVDKPVRRLSPDYLPQMESQISQMIEIEYDFNDLVESLILKITAHDRQGFAHNWEFILKNNGGALAIESMFGTKLTIA